jgi:hypothetical protein
VKTWIRQLMLVAALCPSAAASDWYVDAGSGNNANSGTSPSQAWRTITWAVSQVPPSGSQTIFVAAGTYDVALGEAWPVALRDGLQIVGAGPSSTLLIGTGNVMFRFDGGNGSSFGPSTRLQGMRLVGPGSTGVAVSLYASYTFVDPTLAELEIDGWSKGVYAGMQVSGAVSPALESIDVHHCQVGLEVLGASGLTATDCNFRDNVLDGIVGLGAHGTPDLTFRRCRIESNGGSGMVSSGSDYPVRSTFEDCSLSFNGQDGWRCPPPGQIVERSGTFRRCTIAFNGGKGLYGFDTFNFCGTVDVAQSILWGHVADIDYDGQVIATRNDIGDGSYNGVSGNFAADPLFVNAAAMDLRLGWSSPCIDAVSVAPPAGTLDLVRNARDVDGDLDTGETADLGALEFRTLDVLGPQTLGSILRWELRGPAAAASTLYWTRQPLAPAPTSTPFGQLDLVAGQARVFRVTAIGPNSSTTLQRRIPNSALLVGRTFSFQALTDNPLAPNGKAYTNAVQVTILP